MKKNSENPFVKKIICENLSSLLISFEIFMGILELVNVRTVHQEVTVFCGQFCLGVQISF